MAKKMPPNVIDQALNYIKTKVTREVACSAEPANFAGVAAVALADAALTSADITVGDGTSGARKFTVAAKTAQAIDANGTANHIALVDDSGSELLFVTTCTAKVLATTDQVNFPSWEDAIAQPT